MISKRNWLLLTGTSVLIAIIAHGFMLSEWLHGRYVLGPNDGMSQMVPFKHFLYEAMKEGNFFYSERFGLGGGIFSQLGYYFSTSLVFLLTTFVTAGLELLGVVKTSLTYWADVTVFVSIVRVTAILLLTSYFFKMIGFRLRYAYLAAVIYSISILYFRHVTYWEFFTDAILLLPLLLIGAERIMCHGKLGIFILAVTLSMIDNFYFAYVNFLLAFIYIVFRWFIPLSEGELKKKRQIIYFLVGGLAGAAMSAPFFIPSVYGYLNNFRPPYEDVIPIFDIQENILSNGKIVVLPAIAVFGLLLIPLYKNRLFRLFALLTAVLAVLHSSPVIGSLFNGLSAPQNRWEHLLMLAAGGVAAGVLQNWKSVRFSTAVMAAGGALSMYAVITVFDPLENETLYSNSLIVMAVMTFAIALLATVRQFKHWDIALYLAIICSALITVNLFQNEKLTKDNPKVDQVKGEGIPRTFFKSDEYNASIPRELIHQLAKENPDPLARFEWMIGIRNNTPIVQDFLGTSIYSSILNQQLLHFYLDDLAIDMGRESVSRYAGLGGRANLYSLLHAEYAVRDKEGNPIPFGFQKVAEQEEYRVFESSHRLPFVRTAKHVYTEEELADAPVIAREHAMLSGIILEDTTIDSESAPSTNNLIQYTSIDPVNATFKENELVVTGETGGLDITIDDVARLKEDTYVSFHLQRKTADKGFNLQVNDYETSRKRSNSIYRTRVDDMTIRIPSEKVIRLRVPKGTYTLRDLELYAEDYETLREAVKQTAQTKQPSVEWNGGRVSARVMNENADTFAVMPIPFEKGWRAYVNGNRVPILQANYAFTGIPIKSGENKIELKYYPPFFGLSLFIAILTGAGLIIWKIIRHRKNLLP